jgi:hypothetical protein
MNVLGLVIKELSDEIERQKDEVCFGTPKDYAEYRHICGVITGLTKAETLVKELNKKLENLDD